jgi:cytidylate kinase
MECSVVAISRALGAGGEQIAANVAEKLGFKYVDDEIIARAAEESGFDPDAVAASEKTESFIMRSLSQMALADPSTWAVDSSVLASTSGAFQKLIEQAIRKTAEEGNVVIVAHGASIPLGGMPGLLRVLITGSVDERVKRAMEGAGLSEKDARKTIEYSDNQRKQFLERFYKVKQETPAHYDLIISTDVLDADHATRLILAAVEHQPVNA